MKEHEANLKANGNILMITYLVVALFACLVGYFSYFIQVQSRDVINNSYNTRLDRFSDRIVRGKLMSRDGVVLAKTEVLETGEESRVYPYGALFAHSVGYSTHGKTGLESLANFYLLRSHVNLAERVINELADVKNLGDNVVTTLDTGLQQIAYDALGDRKGAVIVMEPDTGKILAMVSKPNYDPNTLDADWTWLISPDNKEGQLLNRATQGLYPPGSTFKIVTALEYVRENPGHYNDDTFDCDGFYEQGEYTIKCYHETPHGLQNLEQAFANSCNGAFSNLGLKMNLSSLEALSNQLLFNSNLPLTIPYTKSSYRMQEGADTWEILQTSIGQGITQITPLHNLMITAAIANGGVLMKPYLIDYVENVGGQTVEKFLPNAYGTLMSAEESAILSRFMQRVVTEGTGSGVRTDAYSVAGKTGSAEFETGKETHAWFVGFAPAENPQLAISVIVEESGSGGKEAAPIARSIFDAYFNY